MVTPGSQTENDLHDDNDAFALAAFSPPTIPSYDSSIQSTQWDGTKESLGSFFPDLEMQLSLLNPQLTQLAIDGFVMDRNKCIIFHPAQAAQLDGHQPRPVYTWDDPAPTDNAAYAIQHEQVVARYEELRSLNDPRPDLPPLNIPNGTAYPINDKAYTLSPPLLQNYNTLLRNNVLRFISDPATRLELSKQFPRDGRGLLDKLRIESQQPLTITQVDSILASIDALIDRGLTEQTVSCFQNLHLAYNRLLQRIPTSNPSRDTPPQQANKLIKATMGHDPTRGRALLQPLTTKGTDRSKPSEVAKQGSRFGRPRGK